MQRGPIVAGEYGLTEIIAFGVFLIANLLAASTGALFRPGPWYQALNKPAWRPPDWLFGPVWMVLYLMISTAGWRVWREAGLEGAAIPLGIYGLQLVLNALWSAIFFGARRMDLAFYELVALWLSIAATIAVFYPIDPLAGWLLVPYLCWVSFAGILNRRLWVLNPDHRDMPVPAD